MKRRILTTLLATAGFLAAYAQGIERRHGHDIWLAASDSFEEDKKEADLVCDGKADQDMIQRAIDALGPCGTVKLAAGNYFVSAFKPCENGPHYAIRTNLKSKIILAGAVRANGGTDMDNPNLRGTRIIVTQECYDGLDTPGSDGGGTEYAVIGGTFGEGFSDVMSQELTVQGISIHLPDNQKNIICIDGFNVGAMNVDGCRVGTKYMNRDRNVPFHVGVRGCIGIRGLQGSNNGSETIFQSTYAVGLGVGFALCGEHLVCIQLGAIGNLYGYTFNGFEHVGCWAHPITLINCCDEVSANRPFFGDNPHGQAVNLLNFNFEHYPMMFSMGGDYAREAVPGQWRGNIDFDAQDWEYSICNSPYRRFWAADGSGANVKTRNNAHHAACSEEELAAMAPDLGEILLNTTSGMPVYCVAAGDYASARIVFKGVNRREGAIRFKVGSTVRTIGLDKVYSTVDEMVGHIYKSLFYDTSIKREGKDTLVVWSQKTGRLGPSSRLGARPEVDFGETGIRGAIEVVSEGADNQWIELGAKL